jgi:hypothetical protein
VYSLDDDWDNKMLALYECSDARCAKKKNGTSTCSSAASVYKSEGKAIPVLVWTGPEGYRKSKLSEFLENLHVKVQGCQP